MVRAQPTREPHNRQRRPSSLLHAPRSRDARNGPYHAPATICNGLHRRAPDCHVALPLSQSARCDHRARLPRRTAAPPLRSSGTDDRALSTVSCRPKANALENALLPLYDARVCLNARDGIPHLGDELSARGIGNPRRAGDHSHQRRTPHNATKMSSKSLHCRSCSVAEGGIIDVRRWRRWRNSTFRRVLDPEGPDICVEYR